MRTRAFTILLFSSAVAAAAQDSMPSPPEAAPAGNEAPPAENAAPPRRWLALERLTFDLGVEARYERRNVVSDRRRPLAGHYAQLNEHIRFEESAGVSAAGWLGSDRLLRFDGAFRYGLRQESFYERRPGPDLREDPDGDLLEYDFRLDALPAGKISASAFGSRVADRVPRAFLPSLDRDLERYGAGLFWNDAHLPMRLEFEHSFEDLRGGADRLDDEAFGRDALRYEATWQPDADHALRLEYEYEDERQRYAGTDTDFDTRRSDLTLDHSVRFGDSAQHSLDTLLKYEDEAGDLAQDTLELAPRLRLRHSDRLTTTWGGQYLEQTYDNFRLRQYRGDAGLIHTWEDLTSTLNVYALRQDNVDRGRRRGGFDVSQWGGSANLAYAKDNSLGRFSGSLTYSHDDINASDDRARGVVLSESVTFRDPQLAYLAQRDVNLLTLVVTDAARARIFVVGRDYAIVRLGRYTALARVPTGRIADGQTAVAAYTYRASADHAVTRDRFDWRVQQDFEGGLGVYYAGSAQAEDLDNDRFVRFEDRDVNHHRLGVLYRRERWSAGGEVEYNDDSIDPYTAFHVNGDARLFDDVRQQLSAVGRLSRFDFRGAGRLDDRRTTLIDAGLSYRYFFSEDVRLTSSAMYRYETDSLFGRTNGVDVSGAFECRIGKFLFLLEAEYDLLDLQRSSDDSASVWLKLRREIPVIGNGR